MNEAVDMGMQDYGQEEEVDKAYQEVCDEVGIELTDGISTASKTKFAKAPAKKENIEDIEAKLNELKK